MPVEIIAAVLNIGVILGVGLTIAYTQYQLLKGNRVIVKTLSQSPQITIFDLCRRT